MDRITLAGVVAAKRLLLGRCKMRDDDDDDQSRSIRAPFARGTLTGGSTARETRNVLRPS